MDSADDFGTATVGDVDVHEHDIGRRGANRLHGGGDIAGLTDDLDLLAAAALAVDLMAHPGAKKLMVVDDEEAQRRGGRDAQFCGRLGSTSATSVP